MKRLFTFLALLSAVSLQAAPGVQLVPRWNGNPPMAATTAAPTTDPRPAYATAETGCASYPCTGQSKSLTGALYLGGCTGYRLIIYGDGGTLSGGGTVNIYGWPEFPADAGGANLWAQNLGLTETITVPAGSPSQIFLGHAADGIGWIYAAPNGITLSAGVPNVDLEAVCAN